VHFRLCLQGKHQELERCGWKWKFLIAHFIHYFSRSRLAQAAGCGALDWGFNRLEMSNDPSTTGQRFERLVAIMARLRAPGGCPWDREQNFDTIKPYLLEETYEVLDAIDRRDWPHLAEELGDLLLQAVFFAQMASEEGKFRIDDSVDAITEKLIRRHPHVFGDGSAKTADDVKRRWDEIKAEEKKSKGEAPRGLLESVPRKLPALVEAQQISSKAAAVGFDWENAGQVLEKLDEELQELAKAREHGSQAELEGEVGDLLFVLVNLARFLKVDPEQALRKTNAKFRKRFAYVESRATLPGAPLEEMEALWQDAKSTEI
jgi:MazG family protein